MRKPGKLRIENMCYWRLFCLTKLTKILFESGLETPTQWKSESVTNLLTGQVLKILYASKIHASLFNILYSSKLLFLQEQITFLPSRAIICEYESEVCKKVIIRIDASFVVIFWIVHTCVHTFNHWTWITPQSGSERMIVQHLCEVVQRMNVQLMYRGKAGIKSFQFLFASLLLPLCLLIEPNWVLCEHLLVTDPIHRWCF